MRMDVKKERNYSQDKKTGWLWIAIGIAILLFYYIFDPLESRWMPQCLFHKITGLQCMGCGTQRMAHLILHGDISGAFQANAFVFLSLPFIGFLIFVETNRKHNPNLYSKVHSLWVIITISALLLAWLILRNIWGI